MTTGEIQEAKRRAKYAGMDNPRIAEVVRQEAIQWTAKNYPEASDDEAPCIEDAFMDGVYN